MNNQASSQVGFAGFRVLLVEEDEVLAHTVLPLLTKAGMSCEHAMQARSGMEMFQKQEPQLVLLSLGLPRLGGAVLCEPIRARSTVPIIVLSVRTRREDHFHALKLGADDFVTMRPPDETMIMARVLTLLRRVYQYERQPTHKRPDIPPVASPQSQLPSDWVTCEACDYMGPQHRFERRDSLGNRMVRCPHCERSQSLSFTIA